MRGAEAIIEGLKKHDVELVFGYPGGAVLPIYDAMRKSDIKHVLVRGEQGAVHAASGYARIKDQVGVAMATSGPGATNLVTGIATAYMDSIPIVIITGQVDSSLIGTDAFQEVDITGVTEPITKHNYLVKNADEIPQIMEEAFYLANSGRKGPVLIDVPKDIANSLLKNPCTEMDLPGYKPTMYGHPSQINRAIDLINKSKCPLIQSGGGVMSSNSWDLVCSLAEKINAPVVSTLMGIGSMDHDHPLYLGMIGLHGMPAANYGVSNCDLLINIGARFGDRVTGKVNAFAPNAKIIHIDIDPAEIGKNIPSRMPIVGHIPNVLNELVEQVNEGNHEDWLNKVNDWKSLWQGKVDCDKLHPSHVINAMCDLLDGSEVITTDVGQHQMFAAQYYKIHQGRHFICSGGLGTMGYGVPAAIGCKMADKSKTVIAITGDGSLQMNMNEFGTIKDQDLDIKVILFNNNALGLVRQLQYHYCDKNYYAIDLPGNPDFQLIAGAYNMGTFLIEKVSEVESTLKEALSYKGSALIECRVDHDCLVLPIVPSGKGLSEMIIEG